MATYTSVWSPAGNPAGGGAQDTKKFSAVAVTTATAAYLIGLRQKFVVVVTPSPAATAASCISAVTIRFSLSTGAGSATASAADFGIPINGSMMMDTSDAFDTVEFFNTNSVAGGTVDIYVMRLAN